MSVKKKTVEYKGENSTISWDGRLCIHAGECGRAHGDLFVMGREPWCAPDAVDADDAREIVSRCPTGALAMVGETEAKPASNCAHVANDGPLYFDGDLKVDGAEDMPSASRRVALCRCGASKTKPFCDNSHQEAGFRDAGAIGESGLDDIEKGGELEINRIPDGPLEVVGNLMMRAGSGRKAWQGRKVYLCRCGASKNKPFCDGSHKDIGFKAD